MCKYKMTCYTCVCKQHVFPLMCVCTCVCVRINTRSTFVYRDKHVLYLCMFTNTCCTYVYSKTPVVHVYNNFKKLVLPVYVYKQNYGVHV